MKSLYNLILVAFVIGITNFYSNAQCDHTVTLRDSYGDGWNGGSLNVMVNGAFVLTNLTISSGAGPESHTFTAKDGDAITVDYFAGSYSWENYFSVQDGGGNYLTTASSYSPEWRPYYDGANWSGTGACPAPTYCLADGGTIDEYIAQVDFLNISNSSGTSLYTDYTHLVADGIGVGETHPINIVNGQAYGGDQLGIWIDWNQDLDFDDADETITVSGGPDLWTANITVPGSVPTGVTTTRMRIRIMYSGSVSSCGSASYGEVEDYTITTIGSSPCSGTPTGGTASLSASDNCAATGADVSVTGFENSTSGLSYDWEGSANGSSGWTGLGVSASTGVTATPAATHYYRYATTCSYSGITGYSNTIERTVATITSGGDVTRCGTGSVTMTASTNSGVVNWYSASNCCFTGATGNTYGPLTISSTLYRWAASSECTGTKVAITAYVLEAPTADAGSDVDHCNGSSSVLSGSGSMTAPAIPSGYANCYATSNLDTYISNVTFNSISTTTGANVANVETDNTGTVISVDAGSAYTLSITTTDASGSAYTHGIAAFIDWNRDGDFADASETVYTTSSEVAVGTYSTTVNVPSGASEGDMMLRVVANESSSAPSSTGTYSWGETEKYTVRVNPVLTYAWTPDVDLDNAAIAAPTTSTTSTRTYTLTVTAGNGCTGTDDVIATVNELPVSGTVAVTDLSVSGNSDLTEAIEADAITWTNSGTANGDIQYFYQWTDNSGSSPTGAWNAWVTTNPNVWNANSSGANMNRTLWVKTVTTSTNGCGSEESSTTWIDVRNCRAAATGATVSAGTVANMPFGETITYTATMDDGAFERFQYQWGSSSGAWSDWSTTNPLAYATDINAGQTLYVRSKITGASSSGSPTCTDYSDPVQTLLIDCDATSVVLTNNESGSATEVTCDNTGISVTASNADSYTWSDGASTSATREFTSAGTYTVTGHKTNGCQTTSNITVTVNNTAPTATITGDASYCSGTGGVTWSATSSSANGGSISSYSWQVSGFQMSTSTTYGVALSGTYDLVVTNSNGCTDTDSKTLSIDANPTVGITNNELGNPTAVTCTNTAISVTATGATSYTWSDGASTSASRSFSSAATYTVTGTDGNGCVNTAQITITENNTDPTVGITNNESGSATEVNCNNTEISVTATGADTYTWSDGASTSTSRDLTAANTYTVTGTTTSSGCTNTAQITITVDIETPLVTSASVTDVTSCGINTYNVALTSSYSGVWSVSPADAVLFDDNSAANTTVTANPAASGFNTDITLTWTQGAGGCIGSTDDVVVKFNVPVESFSQDTDTYIWGGLTDTEWTTASNWYKWDGSRWAIQSSSYPSSTSKVHYLSNGNAGVCVSSSNDGIISTSISSLNVHDGAELNLGSQSISLSGDITNNNGTIVAGSAVVTLNGSSAQTIGGTGSPSTDFSTLIVNNSSGVTMEIPVTVTGTFTMTSGNVANGSNVLTLGTSSLNTGILNHTSGIVNGKLRRYFTNNSNSKFFPVGSSTTPRDVTVNFLQGPGTNQYLTVAFNSGAPQNSGDDLYNGLPLQTPDGQWVQNCSNEGYWEINPTNDDYGTSINGKNYNVSLRMNNLTGVVDYSKVRIIKSAGSSTPSLHHSEWSGLTHISTTGSNSDFTTIAGPSTGFSFFGGGGGDGGQLPVELVSFNGGCNDGVVDVTWQTASEYNSSHYDVEHSRDGVTWDVVHTQSAAGNSTELLEYSYTDAHAISGDNYYRLTQVDIDGTEKTYDVINASCTETTSGYFSVFPNPSSGSFQVIMNNSDIIGGAVMNIVDTKGTIVLQKPVEVKTGINMYLVNQELSPGIYYISVKNGNKSTIVLRHSVQ